ncbi:hypothetical protein ABID97_000475 [Variovorax sp. OAS795]|uniref:hypothetical protein n=1 Tax=Variovorax sp. OAS795 TaxID=3034231 RepID=UPI0033926024
MDEKSVKVFLDQFSESHKRVQQWPEWMRQSTRVDAAYFPRTQKSNPVQVTNKVLALPKK